MVRYKHVARQPHLGVTLASHTHTYSFFFFFNDTATTEIYTLSLHDALPICIGAAVARRPVGGELLKWAQFLAFSSFASIRRCGISSSFSSISSRRSEEHTSELQSPCNLVCRLLLEKKKNGPLQACSTATTSWCYTRLTHSYLFFFFFF